MLDSTGKLSLLLILYNFLAFSKIFTLYHTITTLLDTSKLKEFADDSFTFDKKGKKFFNLVGDTGNRRNCLL